MYNAEFIKICYPLHTADSTLNSMTSDDPVSNTVKSTAIITVDRCRSCMDSNNYTGFWLLSSFILDKMTWNRGLCMREHTKLPRPKLLP